MKKHRFDKSVCILRFFGSLNAFWASKLAPSWLRLAYLSEFEPKLTQVGSKLAPVGPKLDPSWLQIGSNWAHNGPKLAPTWLKLGPRWAQLQVPSHPWTNPSPSRPLPCCLLAQTPTRPKMHSRRSNLDPKPLTWSPKHPKKDSNEHTNHSAQARWNGA